MQGRDGQLRLPQDHRREDSQTEGGQEAKEVARRTWGQEGDAHIEDLEAGDVQDPNERGALPLGLVQGLVDTQHQPAEHALVGGLGQGLDGKVSLGEGRPGHRVSDTREPSHLYPLLQWL